MIWSGIVFFTNCDFTTSKGFLASSEIGEYIGSDHHGHRMKLICCCVSFIRLQYELQMRATDAAETEITGDSLWSQPGAPRKTTVLNRNLTPQFVHKCASSRKMQHFSIRKYVRMEVCQHTISALPPFASKFKTHFHPSGVCDVESTFTEMFQMTLPKSMRQILRHRQSIISTSTVDAIPTKAYYTIVAPYFARGMAKHLAQPTQHKAHTHTFASKFHAIDNMCIKQRRPRASIDFEELVWSQHSSAIQPSPNQTNERKMKV